MDHIYTENIPITTKILDSCDDSLDNLRSLGYVSSAFQWDIMRLQCYIDMLREEVSRLHTIVSKNSATPPSSIGKFKGVDTKTGELSIEFQGEGRVCP